jgi:hypothetical protein
MDLPSSSLAILPLETWKPKATILGGPSKAVHLKSFKPTGINGPRWLRAGELNN